MATSDFFTYLAKGLYLGLCYLLYTLLNDLPNSLSNSEPRMCADGTYADRDIDSIQVSLNQDLININHWLIVNKLTLNTSKTEYMLIHNTLCHPRKLMAHLSIGLIIFY